MSGEGVAKILAALPPIRWAGPAAQQARPFHLILSAIARNLPTPEPRAGHAMLDLLRRRDAAPPVVLHVGEPDSAAGPPPGAFGVTNRPDRLLRLALVAVARTRVGA